MSTHQTRKTSLNTKISIIILMMILIATSSIGVLSYFIYRGDSIKYQATTAMAIAESIAAAVDPNEFETILATGQKTEHWDDLKKILDTMIKRHNLLYLYVLDSNYNSDTITYFVEGDIGSETTEMLETEALDSFADKMYETIDTGEPTITDIYDSGEEYGYLVSGFAAIKNSSGKVIGVVGADMTADSVINEADAFLFKIIASIIGFSIVFIIIAILYLERIVRRPLRLLTDVSHKIASGDIDVELDIHSGDEIESLANCFMQISDTLNNLISCINDMSSLQNQGDNEAVIDTVQFSGAYRVVGESINDMVMQYVTDTSDFLTAVSQMGNGNFDAQLRPFPGKKAEVNKAVESMRQNLKNVSSAISQLANSALEGNLTNKINLDDFEGDWRKIADTLNELLNAVSEPIGEATDGLNKMSRGILSIKMTGGYQGSFGEIEKSLNSMSHEISSYIDEIKYVLIQVANGSLTKNINREYVGQFTDIKDAINNIVEQLNLLLGDIAIASEQVKLGSSQLAQSSQTLASESNNQNSLVQDLTNIMEQLESHSTVTKDNALKAFETSNDAVEQAETVNIKMKQTLEAMNSIHEASQNISQIIKTMENISSQTNLLALNASVEAARAGQFGKSFAVVAEQVGVLARHSQKATEDTANLIEACMQSTQEGSSIVHQTTAQFSEIMSSIGNIKHRAEDIMTTSDTQEGLIKTASESLVEISNSALTNASTSQETSALSEELTSQSVELDKLIRRFELKKS